VLQRVRDAGHDLQTTLIECLGTGAAVTDRTIDVHVAALRKKLGSACHWLRTI
jgi:DNA-binding response OmpR family regulator